MNVTTLREKLHQYIDVADEQHLSAIYVLVEGRGTADKNGVYDEDTMNMLYQRRENHRNGISASYTVEESMKLIRQNKK